MVVTARQLAGETHYLMVWQSVDRPEVYQYCVTTNSGSASTLLLEFEEVDSAVATDAEVTLAVGDWQLRVYAQANGSNLDASASARWVWSELVRVDGDLTDIVVYPPSGNGTPGTPPASDSCSFVRVCGSAEDGQVPVWNDADGSATWSDPATIGNTTITVEAAVGAINGSNATFTSSAAFVISSLEVYVNGVLQRKPTDYNTTGNSTVIFSDSPQTGDAVTISYQQA
jgi:hypothetical protein